MTDDRAACLAEFKARQESNPALLALRRNLARMMATGGQSFDDVADTIAPPRPAILKGAKA
jgi:hypothetical protein